MKPKILWPLATLLVMAAIFYFSAQNGHSSSLQSSWVLNTFFFWLPQEQGQLIVRKLAHFSIYALLGVCSYKTLAVYGCQQPGWALVFCFAYACSDEIHQIFSEGRACSFIDVLIDTAGAGCGMLLMQLITRFKLRPFAV